MRRVAAALALAATLVLPAVATAASCPRTSLGDVEDEVMCLQCGVPLDVATDAPSAQRERAFIARLIAQCKTKDQVKAALAAQFGDKVLTMPKASGIGLAAYLVPVAAFLAAAALIVFAAIRWRRGRARGAPGEPAAAPAPQPPPADSARLEADLGRYDL